MQETPVPSDPDFFVEWQLADEPDNLIDLSTAESEMPQTDPASIPEYMRSAVPIRR
ncbi:MAG: hypothetical protein ACRDYF_11235 [Acidimicrobiia bacterium]